MNILSQTSRLNQILIVALVVQIALAAFVLRPKAAASESGALLPDFKASEVTEVTITSGEGESVHLAKAGEAWVLPEAGDYPAKGDELMAVLEKLEGIKTDRLVTQTGESHKRLEVAPDGFNLRLDITSANGTAHQLYVGSPSGGNATHVRVGDQPEVYLASNVNPWEIFAQASNWVDVLYFNIPSNDVTTVTLENENGTLNFTREGEAWTMAELEAGETFSDNNFTTLLSQVSSVRMIEPIGREAQAAFGLDKPLATITVKTADETYTLQLGAQDPEDKSYYFKASNSPYYVKVAEFTGTNFLEKTRETYIQAPPTPEAEGVAPEGETTTPEAESGD
jgi:hypothetical protein